MAVTEKEMGEIEKLLDEENSDNIVLVGEDGKEVEFIQIALIPIDEKVYAILQPVELFDDMEDDEAFVFSVEDIDGEDAIVLVSDEDVVSQVFSQYYELLDQQED